MFVQDVVDVFEPKLTKEENIVPDLFALKESIKFEEFDKLYRHKDSVEYRSVVNEIDRRIKALPLYTSLQSID